MALQFGLERAASRVEKEPRELRLRALRDWYHTTLAATDAKLQKLEGAKHLDDPTVAAAWEAERRRLLGVATQRIVELVGKEETAVLREAVLPEELRDVLIRAGAGCDTLMMIGEGRAELEELIQKRAEQLRTVQEKLEPFSGVKRTMLAHLQQKLVDLHARMAVLEAHDIWEPFAAQQYRSWQNDFSSAFRSFENSCKEK